MELFSFTKKKFFKLEERQRQRKCAQVVRAIYESLLKNKSIEEYQNLYETFLNWMGEKSPTYDPVALSNRYHEHLRKAQLAIKEHNLLPTMRRGDKAAKLPFGEVAIYLDNIRSAYNVGSILRTCEALRLGRIYFSAKSPFIDNDKVIKTAMGTASIVPCKQITTLETLPRPWIVLDTCLDAISVEDFIFPLPSFTLIIGNEEYGVSQSLLEQADHFVDIPMLGMKNSINVACAFAIAASKIARQKNA